MEKAETLELYELSYWDLLLISSDYHAKPSSLSSPEELQRLDMARRSVMEALGPSGPGLLSVSGVPSAAALRRALPLARGLAILDPDRRNRVLKEQKLGSDVPLKNPERNVSSFAMQLRYDRSSDSERDIGIADVREGFVVVDAYENLGSNLKELGSSMMDLGIRLARVCDTATGGRELEQSLLESSAAKGRLIHYHSGIDRSLLREQVRRKKVMNSNRERSKQKQFGVDQAISAGSDGETRVDMWQQWHYDYGIFTVLTAPVFLAQQEIGAEDQFLEIHYKECGYPHGHTLLQVFDPSKKGIFMAKASPESFIIQVGESAEVISKGKLRATLHSVAGPGKLENLSRETFVVFLQPAWDKVLCTSDYTPNCLDVEDRCEEQSIGQIEKIVPPLSLRLKSGMTFAEFSRETTRQYYGGTGLQSNR